MKCFIVFSALSSGEGVKEYKKKKVDKVEKDGRKSVQRNIDFASSTPDNEPDNRENTNVLIIILCILSSLWEVFIFCFFLICRL